MFDASVKWIGTICTIGGALATAFAMDPTNIVLFNIGSLAWLIAAIRMKEPALIVVNAVLLTIYIVGIVIRFVNIG